MTTEKQPLLWLSGLLIASHSCLFGAALSSLGPFLKEGFEGQIFTDIPLSTVGQSLATALLLLACIPGAFFTSYFVQRHGPRQVLVANSLIWMLAGFFMLFNYPGTFMVGRFVLGLATGCSSVIPPVLLSEIASPDARGLLTSFHQLAICFMQIFVYLLAWPLVYVLHGWKWLNAVFYIIVGFIALFCSYLSPDSPQYLLKNGRDHEALETLFYLRHGQWIHFWYHVKSLLGEPAVNMIYGNQTKPLDTGNIDSAVDDYDNVNQYATNDPTQPHDPYIDPFAADENPEEQFRQQQMQQQQQQYNVQTPTIKYERMYNQDHNTRDVVHQDDVIYQELNRIKLHLQEQSAETSWSDLKLPQYRKQILICLGLMCLQPGVGINPIALFATKIYGFCGLSATGAMIGTIMIGVLGFTFSMVASIMIDKIGRKPTILIGCLACAGSLGLLAVALLAMNGIGAQSYVALFAVLLYIAAFNIGLGGPIWVILSELTSSTIINKAQSVYCMINWATNFLLVFSALPMMTALGGGESDDELKQGAGLLFIFFILMCLAGAAFVHYYVVETFNQPREFVQELLGNSTKPIVPNNNQRQQVESMQSDGTIIPI